MTTICSGFFFLIGLGIVFAGIRTYRKSDQAAGWPTTMGTVRTSEVRHTSGANNEFHSYVEYEYSVLGTSYVSHTVTFSELMGIQDTNRSAAENIVNKFPVDSAVMVYYDPSNASKSVLLKGGDSGLLVLGGLFMVFSIVFMMIEFFSK